MTKIRSDRHTCECGRRIHGYRKPRPDRPYQTRTVHDDAHTLCDRCFRAAVARFKVTGYGMPSTTEPAA